MIGKTISPSAALAAFMLVMVMMSGCATTDTVSSRLPGLQESINAAKAVDAGMYASTPLNSAESKLEKARQAVQDQDMVTGNRLVDEAMLDAEYARILAPTEKAKREGAELQKEIQFVREEIKQLPTLQ